MKNNIIIPVLLIGIILSSFQTLNLPSKMVKKVVIDAGHGGKDPGCLGKYSYEKDVALKIALEVGELIKTFHKDVEVIYTRDQHNEFIGLSERARLANKIYGVRTIPSLKTPKSP
jgi:N-acetylmuramoyl-L-alanine amidase